MADAARFDPHRSALFTDLYQLTMLQAYYAEGMTGAAAFELFFREMPQQRNYVLAAGLDTVLDFLENLRFTDDELAWLEGQGRFSGALLERLRSLRFTGDVYAMAEGTVVFPHEPVVQVVAPLPEAQLVETFVLNQIHLQSVAATKAARVVTAAAGRTVFEFGSRRSHGSDAALKVGRASYLAGAAGTSNVAAGRLYGVPLFGTMAHSYVLAHGDELAAFRAFARQFPQTTLLVDTYDTLDGVRKVIRLAGELGDAFRVAAVRLDSGDLAGLARGARQLLDAAGLESVKIFASGGLNEFKLARLLDQNAPIDGFGVGTDLAVSADLPDIDFYYKLVAYAGKPRMKLSSSKVNRPGRKQVFRVVENGRMVYDVLARHDETLPGEALLVPVMQGGKRLAAGRATLEQARERARAQLAALPPELKSLEHAGDGYPLEVSRRLQEDTEQLRQELERTQIR
ncbi:MAG: nicotinate phosphoribosyltransferase [Pseudomonadota bacterium]|nr:nicotinate phosphoribosyltransferase [Pseudomonadota bacterium]